ncbi:MAG: COG4280 domain-containing protein [Candidatus Binataceae bacterium]
MFGLALTAHATTALIVAFLASLVEFIEALTIVLAVGAVRGWRHAIVGATAGALLIGAIIVAFGTALGRIPLPELQISIGILLLLFGARWLHKAVLRAAGIIPVHDEARIYLKQAEKMRAGSKAAVRLDLVGVATAFYAVLVEGLEVIFIVIAVGAGGSLSAASVGAAAAGLCVIILGLLLHRPLTKVPENTLKFAVGVLISSFGIFWIGEGLGFAWPGGERALPGLMVLMLAVALLCVWLARASRRPAIANE